MNECLPGTRNRGIVCPACFEPTVLAPWLHCVPQEAIQLDGEILFSLLQKVSPVAHKHLSRQKIDPLLYMTEWFMCAFARTLPWSSVLRVWDMFFCEGTGLGSEHYCL